jgi:hypothetical protein
MPRMSQDDRPCATDRAPDSGPANNRDASAPPVRPLPVAAAVAGVAVLLALFAVVAWTASSTKCMTLDEPMHALGGWLWTHERDFRFDPEDPPLWGYWMAFPNGRDALRVDLHDPSWHAIAETHWTQQAWWLKTLHGTPGNDAYTFVRRARAMALALGVLLGAMVAWYAWKVAAATTAPATSAPALPPGASAPPARGGAAVAAIVAACAFALDPNFLGHAPLVKNDLAISLVFLALSYALWRAGTRVTWANALAAGVLCGAAMSVKFSGVLALPMAGVLLVTRAALPAPWVVLRRPVATRGGRLAATAGVLAAVSLLAVAVVWASYGFRYRAIPDGTPLNIQLQAMRAIDGQLRAADPSRTPTLAQLQTARPGAFVNAVLAINRLRLMPEAWNNGLLYTYQSALVRPSYLLGEVSMTGWWYYFPLAMAFKTPLATMALAIVAVIVAIRLRLGAGDPAKQWALLCLLVPAAIYFLMTLRTNLNIGLRHVLPVYPLLYVVIAWAIAEGWRRGVRFIRPATVALSVLLAAETLMAWPDYIAFFNLAAGGPRGGIRLLGDSSLDWGQDLPLLAQWQKTNPDRPIHLRYFGSADPADFVPHVPLDPAQPQMPSPPAVVAVSATFLQGLYVPDGARPFYDALRRRTPLAVLGGTIYVFEPPALPAASPASASSAADRAANTSATTPSGTSTSP